MPSQSRRAFCLITIVTGLALPATAGAEEKSLGSIDLTRPAAEHTVERIVDQAVINIGRRYNLNNDQLEKTGQIMKTYVNGFLKEHEEEIWPAIRELLASNLKPPKTEADLRRLGASARKLAKLAHKAVKDGNAEWRKILTDEQKKTHDFDLAELDKTFAQMDQNFGSWEDGQSTADNPIFGNNRDRVARTQKSPPTPPRPPAGLPRGTTEPFELSVFDIFVEGFIKNYELDAAQIESARSILKEIKANARNFQANNKDKFAEIEKARNKAMKDKDAKKIREADARRKKLIEPVYQLFADMEGRLKGLLTTVQVERHAAKTKDRGADKPKAVVKNRPAPKKEQAAKIAGPAMADRWRARLRDLAARFAEPGRSALACPAAARGDLQMAASRGGERRSRHPAALRVARHRGCDAGAQRGPTECDPTICVSDGRGGARAGVRATHERDGAERRSGHPGHRPDPNDPCRAGVHGRRDPGGRAVGIARARGGRGPAPRNPRDAATDHSRLFLDGHCRGRGFQRLVSGRRIDRQCPEADPVRQGCRGSDAGHLLGSHRWDAQHGNRRSFSRRRGAGPGIRVVQGLARDAGARVD